MKAIFIAVLVSGRDIMQVLYICFSSCLDKTFMLQINLIVILSYHRDDDVWTCPDITLKLHVIIQQQFNEPATNITGMVHIPLTHELAHLF